jgi:hypothetical protein
MSSVSSGSSSYSCRRITCASTRARSEPKERRDTRFLAVIGFPHAKDVAIRATRRIPYDDYPAAEQTEADDADFTVVPAGVLDLKRRALKDNFRIFEVEPSLLEGGCPLGRVVRD